MEEGFYYTHEYRLFKQTLKKQFLFFLIEKENLLHVGCMVVDWISYQTRQFSTVINYFITDRKQKCFFCFHSKK